MSTTSDVLSALGKHVSYWSRTMRIVAVVVRFKSNLVSAIRHKVGSKKLKKNQSLLDTILMQKAKSIIIKMVEKRSFNEKYKRSMKDKTWVKKSLDPFLDKDGIIFVGGRLGNSSISNNQ